MTTRKSPARRAADAEALYHTMMDVIRFYQFRDRNRAVRYDLTVAHCHVIECLERFGDLSLTGLAGKLYLDNSTTSRIVDTMHRRGLVRRITDDADRRAVRITTTAEGRKRYAHVRRDIIDGEYDFFRRYPPKARRQMLSLLETLLSLGAERDATAPRPAQTA